MSLLPGPQAQWFFVCSCLLCPLGLPCGPYGSWIWAYICIWEDTLYDFSFIAWTVLLHWSYIFMEQWLYSTCHLAIVTFLPKSKAGKKKSLLGDSEESEKEAPPEVAAILVLCCSNWANHSKQNIILLQEIKEPEDKDEGSPEYIAYWKPNVTINLVDDFTRYRLHQTNLIWCVLY